MSESNSKSSEPLRKRCRQTSGSLSGDSRGQYPKVYNAVNNWMNECQRMETLTQKHVLCMYSSECEDCKQSYPHWVMFGGPSSGGMVYFVDSLPSNEEIMKKRKFDLNMTQANNFDCFVKCTEAMFGGLIYDNANNVWCDDKKRWDRLKECVFITRKYGIYEQMAVYLSDVYRAFTSGFYNSEARSAMHSLCKICQMLLDNIELGALLRCFNVGGVSPHSPGSFRVAQFYSEMLSKKSNEKTFELINIKVEDILNLFDVKEVEVRRCGAHVPDFIIIKDNEVTADYVLFGECNLSDSNEKLLVKLWHQSLKGLFQSDTSYGCGAKASAFVFMKLVKINFAKTGQPSDKARINSSLQKFDFVDMEPENPNHFNTTEFCDAIRLMLQIIQESTDE